MPRQSSAKGAPSPDMSHVGRTRNGPAVPRDAGFVRAMATPQGQMGLVGSVPVTTQPEITKNRSTPR